MIVADELKDALLEVEGRAREAVDLMDEVKDWIDEFDDGMDEHVAAQAPAISPSRSTIATIRWKASSCARR